MQPHNHTGMFRTHHLMSRCFVALAVLPALLASSGVFGQSAQSSSGSSAQGFASGSAGGASGGSAGGSQSASPSTSSSATSTTSSTTSSSISSDGEGTGESTSRFRSENNGRVVELEIRNGEIRRATLDGKSLAKDRVRQRGNTYEVLAEDGSVAAQFTAQSARSQASGAFDQEAIAVFGQPMASAAPSMPKSMIGVGLGDVDEALAAHLGVDPTKSTLITTVLEGMPAAEAGLRRFDVIVAIGDSDDASQEKLRSALREIEPGATVKLAYQRGAKRETISVKAVAFDADRFGAQSDDVAFGESVDFGNGVTFDLRGGSQGDVLYFVGPDGKRHEMRMPVVPTLPPLSGVQGQAINPRDIERVIEEAMEQMERRMLERDSFGRTERSQEESARRDDARSTAPRATDRPRDATEERMRRLEEQMERLMRQLEREREERSRERQNAAKPNEA